MTLQERNKAICLMLGLKPLQRPYLGAYQPTHDTHNSAFYHERIEGESWYVYPQYNSSWDWLMEAVKFINKTHNQGNPHRDLLYTINYLLNGGWLGERLLPKRHYIDIEPLFLAVSDFAKVYNEGKKYN